LKRKLETNSEQFGHNDQKAAANISIAQFKTNLAKMVEDVRGSGGSPILVTSLTRRTFNSTTKRVIENLKEHATAALEVAKANDVKLIDLNQASTQYINSIGQVDADKYNLSPSDRTHLNVPGELLFGNMVADLISTSKIWKLGEQTRDYLAPSANIIAAIKSGVFILP
jgi:lysophospholipase L1-like esterase